MLLSGLVWRLQNPACDSHSVRPPAGRGAVAAVCLVVSVLVTHVVKSLSPAAQGAD